VVMIRRQLAEPAASEGAAATGSTVSMAGLAFQPESLTIPAGTEVVFRNDDVAPHTVTDSGGEFDSGILAPGASFTLRVDNSFDYVCTIHPSMKARVALSA
jgi:plastocyanin